MAALTFSGDMRLQDAQAVMRDPQMSRLHDGVRAVSGATILGDGTVALILDVPHVVGARREPSSTSTTCSTPHASPQIHQA